MSDFESFQREQVSLDRQTVAEERADRLLDYEPIRTDPVMDCEDCFGLGCMACKIHGREFIEFFLSDNQRDYICGQCGDEGKGEDSDLPNCTTCGGTGKGSVPA